MHVARLERVALRPAGRPLFAGIDWALDERARVGLVGANGAGKTSLLRLLAREVEPDEGSVFLARGIRVGRLPQELRWPAGTALADVAGALPPALGVAEVELRAVEERLADPSVYGDEAALARALGRQEAVLERWKGLGGDRHRGRVRGLLAHFGFEPDQDDLATDALSGGQKKLAALVALAAAEPELLLLDEPDNHLDLAAKERLEAFVAGYPGAVVIVSHDRYLLDATVDRVASLERGRLESFQGGWSAFATERELRRLRERKRFADQQKEVARIEASIRRFELWASMVVNERHIKQARSRRKALERMQAGDGWLERPPQERSIRVDLVGGRGSRKALEVKGLGLGFDDLLLFDELDLLVRHGERVGLVGPNGCGKSTLLRVVLGDLEPWAGEVRIGPSTRVGHYTQEHESLAAWAGRTPLEWVRDAAPMYEEQAVGLLLRFLFSYPQLREPIGKLSGGERSRLQLARLVLEKPNLLLLDEPTNHLDIPSAEVLEAVLDEFEGAVLVVSHDRYFLDAIVDRVESFENGRLVGYPGGYTDWVESRGAPPGPPRSAPA